VKWSSISVAAWLCLALCVASPLAAAPFIGTLHFNLEPLIDKAAISMSFHGSRAILSPSAALTVSADRTKVKYTTRKVGQRGVWSRPLAGDTLNLSLTVNEVEAGKARKYSTACRRA
jgi:hypothetical protein